MRRFTNFAFILCLSAVIGCDDPIGPEADLRVVVDADALQVDEPIGVFVRNESDRSYWLRCEGGLYHIQQRIDGVWQDVGATGPALCGMNGLEVVPSGGNSVRGRDFGLAVPGTYRFYSRVQGTDAVEDPDTFRIYSAAVRIEMAE